MGELGQLIDNEFSVSVIGFLNLKLDRICDIVSENMDGSAYEEIEGEIATLSVDASKEFFTQGFLRGIAVAKGGAV